MDNLKSNQTGAYLWQPSQTPLSNLLQQPSSVSATPQQTSTSMLNGLAQPIRRYFGNKNNYNYMQSPSQSASSIMIAGSSPGGHLLTLGAPNPNVFRKRQSVNTGYSSGGYQHNGKQRTAAHTHIHTCFDRLMCAVLKKAS